MWFSSLALHVKSRLGKSLVAAVVRDDQVEQCLSPAIPGGASASCSSLTSGLWGVHHSSCGYLQLSSLRVAPPPSVEASLVESSCLARGESQPTLTDQVDPLLPTSPHYWMRKGSGIQLTCFVDTLGHLGGSTVASQVWACEPYAPPALFHLKWPMGYLPSPNFT